MLEILLDPHLDGGTPWRHQLGEPARAGWQPAGVLGFCRRLALWLGLVPADPADEPVRAAVWNARCERIDDGTASWSRSYAHDPFGVARHLLARRDELVWMGWDRIVTLPGRIAEIARLDALGDPPCPPGTADVAAQLVDRIRASGLPIPLTVRLGAPEGRLPPRVRDILAALRDAGAVIVPVESSPAPAAASTDLGRLQRAIRESRRVELTGDLTVCEIVADTVPEAAEIAAAWIRRHGGARTVIVADEGVRLDHALVAAGLPALGARPRSRWRGPLQVLALRLWLSFQPQDPADALALLTLPGGPALPRGLARALTKTPGIGNADWNDAIEQAIQRRTEREAETYEAAGADAGLARQIAAEKAEDLRTRIDRWLGGPVFDPRDGIPAEIAAERCEMVARWAMGRANAAEERDPLYAEAGRVAFALRRMLQQLPAGHRLTRRQLALLLEDAAGRGVAWGGAKAGIDRPAVCDVPGAVMPGSAEVLWWGFHGETATSGVGTIWSAAERALPGVRFPEPGERRLAEAEDWRRAVLLAERRLVLVRWRGAGRETTSPHPLADELAARATGWSKCTIDAGKALAGHGPFVPDREQLAPAIPLVPRSRWDLRRPLAPADPTSFTELEKLFSCPLRWMLGYRAKLRLTRVDRLPDRERLLGSFCHRILQAVFLRSDAIDPDHARELAVVLFEDLVASEAAPLLRAGRELDRARARELCADAASAFAAFLVTGGWTVISAEEPLRGTFAGRAFEGAADLVLERRDGRALLDIKLGGGGRRWAQLASGRALQLALYARALDGDRMPAGYFVLRDRMIFGVDDPAMPGAIPVPGPSLAQTLTLAEAQLAGWTRALANGSVVARGPMHRGWEQAFQKANGSPPPESWSEAECRFCEFKAICALSTASSS